MDANTVGIPIEWFLTSIGGLVTVIGTLAVTIFKIMNARFEDEKGRSKEAMEALNSNSQALEHISELVDRLVDRQFRGA